mgnify:CR=1 FL=1
MLCAENVSENEKSGKAEYSYFVPALWHLLLSPPPTPIAHLILSTADLAFFAPHPVRIFRRSLIDAPRRGRRSRRPAHVSAMSPAGGIFRAPSAGHFWPQRPDNLFLYAAGGHISFNSERNMEKNAAKNQRFLDFPCPIPTTVQKGSATNRLYPHPRCRSHAPRGDAPVCYRAAGLLRPYRRFPEYRRSSIDAPRRGRRSRRPVAFLFPHASGEGYSALPSAGHFWPQPQK